MSRPTADCRLPTAPLNPWIQTVTGRAVDLVNPTPEMIDLDRDIPEALARLARFNGHVASGPYSVAQHCVIGARAVLAHTGSAQMALAFLLHDAHEAYIGDIATPVGNALDSIYNQARPSRRHSECHPRTAIGILKTRLDVAIYARAGLAPPWDQPGTLSMTIKNMDTRMLATERRDLMGPAPRPWAANLEAVPPLRQRITVWPWPRAADEYRAALREWLPPGAGLSPARPAPTTTLKRPGQRHKGPRL